MFNKRSLTAFAAAFAFVLLGGVALAQVGALPLPSSDETPLTDAFGGGGEVIPLDGYEPSGEDEPPPPAEDGKEAEEARPDEEKAEEPEPEGEDHPAKHDERAPHDGEVASEEPAHDEEPAGEEPHAEEPEVEPLWIEVLGPENGAHVEEKVIAFEGKTNGTGVYRGRYEAHLNDGVWRIELVLSPGKNVVAMVAVNALGQEATDSVTVYYDPPEGEHEGEKEHEEVGFSANQKYGSCGEDPPYDVFYGTAAPGTKIVVESPFGGGTTQAGENGGWDLKVHFYEAPLGEVFEVWVGPAGGDGVVFPFVNTGGDHGDK